MSANTIVNTVVANEKKPVLSAKYSKFLVFGYGFVKSLEAKGTLSAEGVESAFEELRLMGSVEDQTQLYESVLEQSKETSKVMRKFVTLRNKPPKAPRAKKAPAAKKAAVEGAEVKQPRAKKATRVENDSENDLVNQLVIAANTIASDEVVVAIDNSAEKAAKDAEKATKEAEKVAAKEAKDAERATKEAEKVAAKDAEKATKDAEKVAAKEAKDAEKATKEAEKVAAKEAKEAEKVAVKEAKEAEKVAAKEAKEAEKAAKSVKTAPVVIPMTAELEAEAEIEAEEEEEEEIHTTEIVIGGKSFLIDNENNAYSVDTHEPIGTYNPDEQTISADL